MKSIKVRDTFWKLNKCLTDKGVDVLIAIEHKLGRVNSLADIQGLRVHYNFPEIVFIKMLTAGVRQGIIKNYEELEPELARFKSLSTELYNFLLHQIKPPISQNMDQLSQKRSGNDPEGINLKCITQE